ncbi:MAG: YitT family protein [Bacilli bacterium]|nr:YitT family protein [Bacilli bacterium]MDD4406546.1 YitT family protein [Bacilli bacterium]
MNNKNKILNLVNSKNRPFRLTIFILALFFIAVSYNLILTPNQLIIGGMSGLAIVINEITGLSIVAFLYITTVILFILSLILLDKKTTFKALFGSLCFNTMVTITKPLVQYIKIDFDSAFMIILLASLITGITTGIIYRTGYNTGGGDIIITILHRYLKIPMGKASTLTNIFIIGSGLIVFGPTKTLYALFILLFGNYITDIILLGIKDFKMCFIKSKNTNKISHYLINKVNIGITEMSSKNVPVLLVIVPTDKYYGFKHAIKNMDNKAFILTINCYGVTGGYKKQLIPF